MPNISGSFSGRATSMTILSANDVLNHEIHAAQVIGTQKSPDHHWNECQMTYWGTSDLTNGNGMQRGYFVNQHQDGDRDWGTFEAKITTVGGQMTTEGNWKFVDGTGTYKGLTGSGTFKGRMTAPGAFEDTWEGTYQLAVKTQAA